MIKLRVISKVAWIVASLILVIFFTQRTLADQVQTSSFSLEDYIKVEEMVVGFRYEVGVLGPAIFLQIPFRQNSLTIGGWLSTIGSTTFYQGIVDWRQYISDFYKIPYFLQPTISVFLINNSRPGFGFFESLSAMFSPTIYLSAEKRIDAYLLGAEIGLSTLAFTDVFPVAAIRLSVLFKL